MEFGTAFSRERERKGERDSRYYDITRFGSGGLKSWKIELSFRLQEFIFEMKSIDRVEKTNVVIKRSSKHLANKNSKKKKKETRGTITNTFPRWIIVGRKLVDFFGERSARKKRGTRETGERLVGTNAFAISWLWQRSLSIHTTMRRDINYEILR